MAKFLLNKNIVIKQFEDIKKMCDIFSYSYKTNNKVGDILQDNECYFSINSYNSIKKIKNKTRIIYFLQGETIEQILNILSYGINIYVVDNKNDLNNLLKAIKQKDKKVTIFLRIKLKEHTIFTGKYFVYGFNWDKIPKLINQLSNNKNVKDIGLHVHRKTQNTGEWNLINDFKDLFELDSLIKIKYINIGGGLPYTYVNSKPDIKMIKKKILEFKNFVNSKGIKMVMESGRYISAPSVRLITKIINLYDSTIVIDCSIFNSYMDTFLLNIKLPVLNETDHGYRYLIKGRSPDSLDIFRYRVYFKEKKRIGDQIIFLNAGAYNFHTEFNNFDKIKTIIVNSF